jgi:hypothetical protein
MMWRLVLLFVLLLILAVIIVIRELYMSGVAVGVTVLVPIIFVGQLIDGWICLHNLAKDSSNEEDG